MIKPHLKFFWGFWHVYKSANTSKRNLLGAALTAAECMTLYKEYQEKQSERTRKSRSKANPSRRSHTRRRRGR